MKTIFLITSLLCCLDATAEYEFIVGDWISDSEEIVNRMKETREMTEQQRTELIKAWPVVKWKIDLANLTYSHSAGSGSQTAPYSIRPIDENSLEFVVYVDGNPDVTIIEKTDFGFCATNNNAHWYPDLDIATPHTDCFKRDGT